MQTPKVDLHLHLDGSLLPGTIAELHREKLGFDLPKNALVSITEGQPTLTEYLEYFKYPILVVEDNLKALERVAYEMVRRLNQNNVRYAEVRYAPQLLTKLKSVRTYTEIILAVNNGFLLGMKDYPGTIVKTIICLMRGLPYEINRDTYEAVKKVSLQDIVALDLAGDEINFSGEEYKDIFQDAKENDYHLTIHAGEGRGPESIRLALDFGAERIGHGLSLHLDEHLLAELAERKICIESCPISNFQTGAALRYGYNIKDYLLKGVPVTVNTDNLTVSNTNLDKEFQYLKEQYLFTEEDLEKMRRYSLLYAFTDNLKNLL